MRLISQNETTYKHQWSFCVLNLREGSTNVCKIGLSWGINHMLMFVLFWSNKAFCAQFLYFYASMDMFLQTRKVWRNISIDMWLIFQNEIQLTNINESIFCVLYLGEGSTNIVKLVIFQASSITCWCLFYFDLNKDFKTQFLIFML